jgi:hypothetical protein
VLYIGEPKSPAALRILNDVTSEPLDQTNLKQQHRLNLNGGGEPTYEAEADQWGQHISWVGRSPSVRLRLGLVGLPSEVF